MVLLKLSFLYNVNRDLIVIDMNRERSYLCVSTDGYSLICAKGRICLAKGASPT